MTTFNKIKNGAYSTIADAGGITATSTSITVQTGHGERFPATGSFWVTIWDAVTYPNNPHDDPNMEVVLASARSGDLLPIDRAKQNGTTAKAHGAGHAVEILVQDKDFSDLQGAVNTLEAGDTSSWTAFTPTWSCDGATQPSIGDGTFTGRYKQVGKTVYFKLRFKAGSTTAFGTAGANYLVTFPVAPQEGTSPLTDDAFSLGGYAEDAGVTAGAVFTGRHADSAKFYVYMGRTNVDQGGTGTVALLNPWRSNWPITWASGDFWAATGFYEVA